jgi:hypothetical protein
MQVSSESSEWWCCQRDQFPRDNVFNASRILSIPGYYSKVGIPIPTRNFIPEPGITRQEKISFPHHTCSPNWYVSVSHYNSPHLSLAQIFNRECWEETAFATWSWLRRWYFAKLALLSDNVSLMMTLWLQPVKIAIELLLSPTSVYRIYSNSTTGRTINIFRSSKWPRRVLIPIL